MKVEELSQYGKSLNGLPEDALKAQERIAMAEIRNKYGFIGRIPFFIKMFLEQRRLKRTYPEAHAQLMSHGPEAKEFLMLAAMFNVAARSDGRERAYEFMKAMFQKVAAEAGMTAMYQVDELVECEGDVFDNFKKFNVAMFEASSDMYQARFEDETDRLTIIIDRCVTPELASAFDVPEMGKIGCDFDLAGYPTIVDDVNAEFRRPCTIAKGSDHCKFLFYRKATAPDTEEVDGHMVKWEKSLNR